LHKVFVVCRKYGWAVRATDDVLGDIAAVFENNSRVSQRLQVDYFAFGKWQFDEGSGTINDAFYGV